ncbi:hypothetical protein GGR56DRAFT_12726 [Xylariaceae sp. FL0804]|nr:hypothetical protein GGR56DRAFT_12726 [Xylariaceae sp. FL0804]
MPPPRPPPPNWTMGGGYNDDRRWDHYAPSGQARQDRDTRDSRDYRDVRAPRDAGRDADSSRKLRVDTTMPDARPGRASSNSPISRRPAASLSSTPTSAATSTTQRNVSHSTSARPHHLPSVELREKAGDKNETPKLLVSHPPKAKDRKLQAELETFWRLLEIHDERLQKKLRWEKVAREASLRRRTNDKVAGKVLTYPPYANFVSKSQPQVAELTGQINSLEQEYRQVLEDAVAASASANRNQSEKEFSEKFDEMARRLDQQSSDIKVLLEARAESDKTIKTLRTNVSALESKNQSLKDRLDGVTKREKSSREPVTQILSITEGMGKRIEALETKVQKVDTFINHDIKAKLLPHEVEAALDELRLRLGSLEKAPMPAQTQAEKTSPTQHQTIKLIEDHFVSVKKDLLERVEKKCEESDDIMGGMIDAATKQINEIEGRLKTFEGKHHAAFLEGTQQPKDSPANLANVQDLRERVAKLEEKGFGHRIDRIDTGLQNLQSQENQRAQIAADAIADLRNHLDDGGRRLEAVNFQVGTLNSQFSNLSTKGCAEIILQQLDPYAQAQGQRIGTVENMVTNIQRRLHQLEENNHHAFLLGATFPTTKDAASEQWPAGSKKRKLDANGSLGFHPLD